jgi:hypothetical protein
LIPAAFDRGTRPQEPTNDGQNFLALFPRRDCFIWKSFGEKNWRKSKSKLYDHQIIGVIENDGRGMYRGCYWAEQTHHAVLDIDAGSKYHSAQELAELQEKLAAVGLTATPYRSSESGGWHLYIFFDAWAERSEVENSLKAWLKFQGYEIKSGTLEIFPSGNALRLPLQPGFAWLDQEGNVIRTREEITRDEALASFLYNLERNQRNWSEAKNRIQSQLQATAAAAGGGVLAHDKAISNEGFDDLFKRGAIPEICEMARRYWREGLTGPKQRHEALYSLQHLLWFGDASLGIPKLPGTRNDERRHQFLMDWLERNHNGHCNHINRGRWREIEEGTRRKCEWRGNHPAPVKRVPYMVTERLAEVLEGQTKKTGHLFTPADAERANIKREEWAREKIRAAVQLLASQENEPRLRLLMRLTGCHPRTLRRHSDIWKISPLPSVAGHLDPGFSGGGLAVLSEICPDRFEEKKEKEFLDPSCSGDSGDLDVSEDSGSVELAPIVLTPPFLLPGYEPTSEPPASRPSPSGSFGSLDAGAPVRWYSGRTADGAGGLGPSCNELPGGGSEILSGLPGPVSGTGTYSPVKLLAHSVSNASQVQPFGIRRYETPVWDSACLRSQIGTFQVFRYGVPLVSGTCIRVNSPQSTPLRILIYSDVRGPPKRIRAWQASFENDGTIFGATAQKVCGANKRHRLACLRNVQHGHSGDVSRRRWCIRKCKQQHWSGAKALPEGEKRPYGKARYSADGSRA